MDTKELGNLGERIACEYLVKKGFKILGKNWEISWGEIDIIARKKWRFFSRALRPIHFVEVKTIADNGGEFFPEEHVDWKKRRKLRQMSQIWLQKNKYPQDIPHQIDVIGILVSEETRNAKLHYFSNAVAED